MTFSSWDSTGFTATCDASTGYTGTPAAATCSAAGGEYVPSGCTQTDCIAPATTTGYTITANPTAMTFSGWASTGFTATCATGYTGSPTAATCTAAGGEYVLGGCTANTCTPPTSATGYDVTGAS